MKKILFLCIVLLCTLITYAQHTIRLSIKNSEDKSLLAGATATIISLNKTSVADSSGIATFTNIPPGTYQIKVSYVGLEEQEVSVQVPLTDKITRSTIEEGEEHEEEVMVTTTRSSRTIQRYSNKSRNNIRRRTYRERKHEARRYKNVAK